MLQNPQITCVFSFACFDWASIRNIYATMTNHNTLATIVYEWTSFKNKQSVYRVWVQRIYHERNHNICNSMEISLQSVNIRLHDTAYVPWCWWCSKVLRLDLQPELSNIDWSLPLFWSNSPMNQLWGCFLLIAKLSRISIRWHRYLLMQRIYPVLWTCCQKLVACPWISWVV